MSSLEVRVWNNADDNDEVTTCNPKLPLFGYFFRGPYGVSLSNKCIDIDIDKGSFKKLPLTKHVYYSNIQLPSLLCTRADSYTCFNSGNLFGAAHNTAFIPPFKASKTSDLVTASGNFSGNFGTICRLTTATSERKSWPSKLADFSAVI
jgi:hypothetical protein